jgi:hypothetical protein
MKKIPAYQYEMSMGITFYTTWYGQPQTTRCQFLLRNLESEIQEEQIQQSQQIIREVVNDLHHLTGFGIDKSVLKVGAKIYNEIVYPDLKPCINNVPFKSVLFRFSPVYRYEWVNQNDSKKRFIHETDIPEDWQSKAVSSSFKRSESFRLPVIVKGYSHGTSDAEFKSFFRFSHLLTNKRKRTHYGFGVTCDQNDKIFQRFISKFHETGNLAFGQKGFFGGKDTRLSFTGRDWPQSNAKREKYPRKSTLASQPTDNTEYIYFIRAGRTNLYKVGKSNDPQSRIASLQTGNPYKLKLLHIFKADNASSAEEKLHSVLHHKRKEGEWFNLTLTEKNIISSIETFRNELFILAGNKSVSIDALLQ